MNFDKLMQYVLMTELYQFIPFLLTVIFQDRQYSLFCVYHGVNKVEILAVETVREVCMSDMKLETVTHVIQKRRSKINWNSNKIARLMLK